VDGRLATTLRGDGIVATFINMMNDYVASHYSAAAEQELTASR
jgi:hypothetical protein